MTAEKQVTIRNPLGLHVRPSAQFAETASKYSCRVNVIKDGQTVNAQSSIDLLTLAAVAGTDLTLQAEGEGATEAVDELARLVESGFGES